MSVWMLPPGGVRPGASRWSAARAGAAPPRCRSRTAAMAAAAARSTAAPSMRRFATLAEVMPVSLLSLTPLVRRARQIGSNRFAAGCESGAMKRHRAFLAVAVISIAAAATLLGGAFSSSPKANPLAVLSENALGSPGQRALGRLLAGLSNGDTAGYVRRLERRVARRPSDGATLAVLGLAYQQRARESGDPTFYRLSGEALQRARV